MRSNLKQYEWQCERLITVENYFDESNSEKRRKLVKVTSVVSFQSDNFWQLSRNGFNLKVILKD